MAGRSGWFGDWSVLEKRFATQRLGEEQSTKYLDDLIGQSTRDLIREITHRDVTVTTYEELKATGRAAPAIAEFFERPRRTSKVTRETEEFSPAKRIKGTPRTYRFAPA